MLGIRLCLLVVTRGSAWRDPHFFNGFRTGAPAHYLPDLLFQIGERDFAKYSGPEERISSFHSPIVRCRLFARGCAD